jgi:hypothetical protein
MKISNINLDTHEKYWIVLPKYYNSNNSNVYFIVVDGKYHYFNKQEEAEKFKRWLDHQNKFSKKIDEILD